MNLRDIKKDIEYVVGAFIEDCSLFASLHSDSASESVENLLGKAVNLYNDLRDKVNSKTEKKNAAYYKAIRKELLEKTGDVPLSSQAPDWRETDRPISPLHHLPCEARTYSCT